MLVVHIIAAILASWRITELFVQDRITEGLRKRLNSYLFTCGRCMSIWAGGWTTVAFALGLHWPALLWLNWPFALAWLYLTHLDLAVQKRTKTTSNGRRITLEIQPNGNYSFNSELNHTQTIEILAKMIQEMTAHQQQARQANGVVKQ